MSIDSELDKIGFAAIICWDFVDKEEEDELLTTLEDLYGEEPQKHGGVIMGTGGSWQIHVAGNESNQIEDSEEFLSVRTIVESKTKGVLDVTTFAILTDEQIRLMVEKQGMSGIESLQATISDSLAALPSYVDHEEPGHSGLFYVEWGDEDLLDGFGDESANELVEYLRDNHELLSSFGFQVGGRLSIYNGNFIMCPTATMSPFKGLGVLRRQQHPQSGPFDKLVMDPSWYRRLAGLQRYYRVKWWGDSRWSRLHKFDSDANEARDSLLSLSSTQMDVDEVLPVSEEIQSLQIEYTEFSTRFDVEHQAFQDNFSERADEALDEFGNPLDIPLPRAKRRDDNEVSEDGGQSIVAYFEDASESTLEQLNNRYTQVTEKIESLVSAIEGRTRLAATDENLTLQNRVKLLTWILTALTVILVILTTVLVAIELV